MGYNNSDLIFSNIAKGKYTFREVVEKYDEFGDSTDIDNPKEDTLTEKFLRKARGIAKGVKKVAFDKGKYKYHGLIKILAESARTEGLNF